MQAQRNQRNGENKSRLFFSLVEVIDNDESANDINGTINIVTKNTGTYAFMPLN